MSRIKIFLVAPNLLKKQDTLIVLERGETRTGSFGTVNMERETYA